MTAVILSVETTPRTSLSPRDSLSPGRFSVQKARSSDLSTGASVREWESQGDGSPFSYSTLSPLSSPRFFPKPRTVKRPGLRVSAPALPAPRSGALRPILEPRLYSLREHSPSADRPFQQRPNQDLANRIVSISGASVDSCHQKGLALLDSGFPSEARSLLTTAVALNPTDAQIIFDRGCAAAAMADYPAAALDAGAALRLGVVPSAALSLAAVAAEGLGKADDSEELYRQALESDPELKFVCTLARPRLEALQLEARLDEEDAARDLHTDPAAAKSDFLIQRGRIHAQTGAFRRGLLDAEAALSHLVTAEALALKVQCLRALNRDDEAEQTCQLLQSLDPQAAESFLTRTRLHVTGLTQTNFLLSPDAAEWNAVGARLFRERDWTGAETAWQRALDEDPRHACLYLNRATARWRACQFSSALADARIATDLDPELVSGWALLGAALAMGNHFEEAIHAFTNAIRRAPAVAAFHLGRAICRLIQKGEAGQGSNQDGDLGGSKDGGVWEDVVVATRLAPGLPEAWVVLARCHAQAGDLNSARAALSEASALASPRATSALQRMRREYGDEKSVRYVEAALNDEEAPFQEEISGWSFFCGGSVTLDPCELLPKELIWGRSFLTPT
eukprot:Protomagalhaensia_sp_Gyna_25__428@NODE_1200_length_2073_cov_12_437561_g955_i0_p1_GENE_NODE_1200_length_2073_cov_12_437561_g955_i0NODE_1200_length_2073_cov_12_437561_g955_i0_p1_ORF_typecomplete_len623_score136_19TPR_16/PF13432_6/1_9e05TPR_16/PF13432_6/0_083TPR_16/PF13432_6/0_91TPR_16/PF13432_6/0_087TPR_16/PF13432_6/0_0015TPR_16/PF13432_6/3_5e07TPR_16/PF13432_6/0_00045TPR_16/PF13432_6/3_6e05TPR_19/PF14559_6/0_034TPR_19/PF14559_6/11TPR_19/PF14559_6/0_0017TPR_19/PF14559_6/0_00047TPR_19/PF14559_6/0_6